MAEVDLACIARAQAGDAEALSAIYACYAGAIFGYLYRRTDDVEFARDLSASTFLCMLEGIGSWEDCGVPLSKWLFRIAHDRLIDALRRHERRYVVPITERTAFYDGPEHALARIEAETRVRQVYQHLSPDQAQVVRLRFWYDLSVRDTARHMGKKENAVKVLQYRALRRLQHLLESDVSAP